jgi:hypothetical protein
MLLRAEPQVIAHAVELGCTPMTSEQAFQHVSSLLTSPGQHH